MEFYIPIKKIEEEHRLVYGIAAVEEVDSADEIFDYASSRPYIEDWSKEQNEKSGGQSYGNVRAMHGDVSAGKIIRPISFDDEKKTVNVCIKVVDDAEWYKVLEGIYTGLSFGGRYVRRWQDGSAIRYTLQPCELSLADRPCAPSASIIEVIKVDGSVREIRKKERRQMGKEVVKKMDLSEFSNLINDVNAGLVDDENAPQALKDGVQNLAAILADCIGNLEKAAEEEMEKTEEEDAAKAEDETAAKDEAEVVAKADEEVTKRLVAMVAKLEKQVAENNRLLNLKMTALEKMAAPTRVVLKTDGWKLKKPADTLSGSDAALEKIKQQRQTQKSWAY